MTFSTTSSAISPSPLLLVGLVFLAGADLVFLAEAVVVFLAGAVVLDLAVGVDFFFAAAVAAGFFVGMATILSGAVGRLNLFFLQIEPPDAGW
ncbi:MAG: hypothetical protein JO117_08230 [Verrucomicrobia bacterium]|nr:hypothetical protein [Verrucomicrobiota bacterium]MBV9658419.1 hypothetical protein [Verrucomicrobiota bacterium]